MEYKAKVVYDIDASGVETGAAKVERSAKSASNALLSLREKVLGTSMSMARWGASQVGVQLGLFAIGRAAYMGAKELEGLNKSMAGTLNASVGWGAAVDPLTRIKASMAEAKTVMGELEEAESRLAIPASELTGAFNQLGGVMIGRYGMAVKDATTLSVNAAGAAKALGVDVSQVSMSMSRILMTKNVRGNDQVSQFFRNNLGNAKELKAMAPEKLLAKMSEKLAGLGPAAEEMSKGLGGTLFRMEDFFQDTLRDIAVPTVKYLGKLVEEWRLKLESVVGDGKKLSEVLADKVLAAAKKIHSIGMLIADNWKAIATVVSGLALSKMVSQGWDLAKALGEGAKSIAGIGSTMGGSTGGTGLLGGLSSFANALGPAVVAVSLLSAGIHTFVQWLENRKDRELKIQGNLGTVGDSSARALGKAHYGESKAQTEKMLRYASKAGIIDGKGNLVTDLQNQLSVSGKDTRRSWAKSLGGISSQAFEGQSDGMQSALVAERFRQEFAKRKLAHPELWANLGGAAQTPKDITGITKDLLNGKKPKIEQNFTGAIHVHQKFDEADPDNIFIQFKEGLENAGFARVQSALTD